MDSTKKKDPFKHFYEDVSPDDFVQEFCKLRFAELKATFELYLSCMYIGTYLKDKPLPETNLIAFYLSNDEAGEEAVIGVSREKAQERFISNLNYHTPMALVGIASTVEQIVNEKFNIENQLTEVQKKVIKEKVSKGVRKNKLGRKPNQLDFRAYQFDYIFKNQMELSPGLTRDDIVITLNRLADTMYLRHKYLHKDAKNITIGLGDVSSAWVNAANLCCLADRLDEIQVIQRSPKSN